MFVKHIDGKTLVLKVHPTETVDQVKQLILAKTSMPPHTYHLTHTGKPLDDSKRLVDYCISNEATLTMHGRLLSEQVAVDLDETIPIACSTDPLSICVRQVPRL